MKELILAASAIIIVGAALIVVGIGGSAANLLWLPFAYHQQTKIVHNSQGYIEAQRSQLRAFKSDYDTASSPAQRNADLRQMQELADHLQSSDIQPDIAALLNR